MLTSVVTAAVAAVIGIYIGRCLSRRGTSTPAGREPSAVDRLVGQEEPPAPADTGDADVSPGQNESVVPLIRPAHWRVAENFTRAARRVVANAHLQAYRHHS